MVYFSLLCKLYTEEHKNFVKFYTYGLGRHQKIKTNMFYSK